MSALVRVRVRARARARARARVRARVRVRVRVRVAVGHVCAVGLRERRDARGQRRERRIDRRHLAP